MQGRYFTNLDSLRFLAFMCVFIGHVVAGFSLDQSWYLGIHDSLTIGDIGVLFFFVLSGFLITTLLLREGERGVIHIPSFYVRRIKRIWPVYFTVIGIRFLLFPLLAIGVAYVGITSTALTSIPSSALPWFVFFAANFYLVFNGFISPILNILWSVSVEEQFYFLWPLCVKYFSKSVIATVLVAIILFSTWYRYHVSGTLGESFHTFSVMGSLALGAFSAFCVNWFPQFLSLVERMPKYVSFGVYLLLVVLVTSRHSIVLISGYSPYISAFLPLIFSCIFLFVVLEQSYTISPLFSAGKSSVMTWLGKVSYGLYAYHMIAFTGIVALLQILHISIGNRISLFILSVSATFCLTIIFAKLSYEYMEKPILTSTGLLPKKFFQRKNNSLFSSIAKRKG